MKYQFFHGCKYFITYSLADKTTLSFDNAIKNIVLKNLKNSAQLTNIQIEPFAILDNHVHLIANSQEAPVSKKFLKHFAGISLRKVNLYLNREGALWNKYYGWAIFDEHAYFNILAYILGNPLRHGIVKSFDELYNYPYCNFNKYANEFSREIMEDRILTILKIKSKEDEKNFFNTLLNSTTNHPH